MFIFYINLTCLKTENDTLDCAAYIVRINCVPDFFQQAMKTTFQRTLFLEIVKIQPKDAQAVLCQQNFYGLEEFEKGGV